MSPKIRLTREDDAPHLPALEQSAGVAFLAIAELAWIAEDSNLSIDDHLAAVRDGTSWVAIEGDDRPVGFLCAERCGDDLHIHEIAVRHDRQGRGIGRALIEAAIAWAQGRSLSAVTLTTFRNVPWNEPFYARLGFETLSADSIDQRLALVVQQETEHGLQPETRCAMRLGLRTSA